MRTNLATRRAVIDDGASPARLNRTQTKEKTRLALLAAAERCFLRLGYPGATLDAIAQEAGFTKGAVYWHFRNKEALFLELLDRGFRQNSSDAAALMARLAAHPEELDAAIGRWLDGFDGRNSASLLSVEMDLESRRNPSFSALIDSVVAKQQSAVRDVLDHYFRVTGRTAPFPIDEMATTIIALTKAVALARQTRHSADLKTARLVRMMLGLSDKS